MSVTETRVPVIVSNEAEFTETLFKPIDGRTADGYIVRRGKRFVDIWLCGKQFRVNRYLVLCEQGDNGAWYHGILSVPFGFGALTEAFEKLALGSEWQGMDKVYFFN